MKHRFLFFWKFWLQLWIQKCQNTFLHTILNKQPRIGTKHWLPHPNKAVAASSPHPPVKPSYGSNQNPSRTNQSTAERKELFPSTKFIVPTPYSTQPNRNLELLRARSHSHARGRGDLSQSQRGLPLGGCVAGLPSSRGGRIAERWERAGCLACVSGTRTRITHLHARLHMLRIAPSLATSFLSTTSASEITAELIGGELLRVSTQRAHRLERLGLLARCDFGVMELEV